jgi:hypothetical protein
MQKLTACNRAPPGPTTIDLFNVKSFAIFSSLFLPVVKGKVVFLYIDWCSPTTPYSTWGYIICLPPPQGLSRKYTHFRNHSQNTTQHLVLICKGLTSQLTWGASGQIQQETPLSAVSISLYTCTPIRCLETAVCWFAYCVTTAVLVLPQIIRTNWTSNRVLNMVYRVSYIYIKILALLTEQHYTLTQATPS